MDNLSEALQWCRDINGCDLSDSWIERFIFSCVGCPPLVATPLNGWCDFFYFLDTWSCTTPSDGIRASLGRMVSEVFRVYGYDTETNRPITTKEALRARISARLDMVDLDNNFRDYCIESIYDTIVRVSVDLCDTASLHELNIYDIFDGRGFDSALLHSIFGTIPTKSGRAGGADALPTQKRGEMLPVRVRAHIVYELMKRGGVTLAQYDKTDIARLINAAIGGNPAAKIRNVDMYKNFPYELNAEDAQIIAGLFEPFK